MLILFPARGFQVSPTQPHRQGRPSRWKKKRQIASLPASRHSSTVSALRPPVPTDIPSNDSKWLVLDCRHELAFRNADPYAFVIGSATKLKSSLMSLSSLPKTRENSCSCAVCESGRANIMVQSPTSTVSDINPGCGLIHTRALQDPGWAKFPPNWPAFGLGSAKSPISSLLNSMFGPRHLTNQSPATLLSTAERSYSRKR